MNGWFLAAGALSAAAFFVHLFSGNRFYSAARPGCPDGRLDGPDCLNGPDSPNARPGAYEAWLMGRCGMQMIAVDLFLAAAFLLLRGFGLLPRNFGLEVFLLAVFGGWGLFWLVSLACERAGGRHYVRLCHWGLFFVLAGLVLGGMLG